MLPVVSKSWVLPVVMIIFLSIVHRGSSIMCWECNSHYDPDCKDPFNNHTISLTDCEQRTYTREPSRKATVCRKIIQKVQDEYRYIRGCGWLSEDREGQECIKRAGTFHVLITYCSCKQNGCNSAANLQLNWMAAMGLLLSVFSPVFMRRK